MKRLVVALILGLAMGYNWGYDEGTAGKESVVARALDHFGTSKVKAAEEARERQVDAASRP